MSLSDRKRPRHQRSVSEDENEPVAKKVSPESCHGQPTSSSDSNGTCSTVQLYNHQLTAKEETETGVETVSFLLYQSACIPAIQRMQTHYTHHILDNYIYVDERIKVFVSGSAAENLTLHDNYSGITSDFDIMIALYANFRVENTPNPGYAILINDEDGDELYRNQYITTDSIDIKTYSKVFFKSITGFLDLDEVVCLAHPQWPEIAEKFLYRERSWDWPSTTTLQEIRNQGCHFVPVAHPFSENPDCEWRYSFSRAELILANTLTALQKGVYIITKRVLKNAFLKTHKFKSYYLKNALFWLCEKTDSECWSPSNFFRSFHDLVRELKRCLIEGNLPHFFINENNLIAHLATEDLHPMIQILNQISNNEFQIINETYHSNDNDFLSFISGMIETMHTLAAGRVPKSMAEKTVRHKIITNVSTSIEDGAQLFAVDLISDYTSFYGTENMSFAPYFYLNFWHLFQNEMIDIVGAFPAFRVLYDLPLNQQNKDNVAMAMGRIFGQLDLPLKGYASVYYSVFLYLMDRFYEAYEHSYMGLRSHERLEEWNASISICPLVGERLYLLQPTPGLVSGLHAYVYVHSAKQLERDIDITSVYETFRHNLSNDRQGDTIMLIQFLSMFMEMDMYSLALFVSHCIDLPNYAVRRVCIMLELLCIRINSTELDTDIFDETAKELLKALQTGGNHHYQDRSGYFYSQLARICRSTRTPHNVYMQSKCLIFYSLAFMVPCNDTSIREEFLDYLFETNQTSIERHYIKFYDMTVSGDNDFQEDFDLAPSIREATLRVFDSCIYNM